VSLSVSEHLVAQPFTWNRAYGYEWDCFAGTGLYHVGARAYDPRTARWLQRDPIDAASGDPNLYRYCRNDPVNCADPSGLIDVKYRKRERIHGSTSGLRKKPGTISKKSAINARLRGEDVEVIGSNWTAAKEGAREVESVVSKQLGKPLVHHEAHDDPRLANPRPHFQTKGHKGHTFYDVEGAKRRPGRGGGGGSRGAGRMGVVLGILLLGLDLANAQSIPCEERPEAIGSALGDFAGGLAGAWAGAAAGAAIGTAIAPGIGTAIGGAIGGLIGGFAGGYLGSELGEAVGGLVQPRCRCP